MSFDPLLRKLEWLVVGVGFVAFVLLMFVSAAHAKRVQHEDVYNRAWCAEVGGTPEQVQPDRSRVDCLTEEHAIEMDFAEKWYEGVGQAAHYARMTGRRPGLVLIVEHTHQCRRLYQARETISNVWISVGDVMARIRLWVTFREGVRCRR